LITGGLEHLVEFEGAIGKSDQHGEVECALHKKSMLPR
jgi:hypothetical protein